jgi:hypothetical protein
VGTRHGPPQEVSGRWAKSVSRAADRSRLEPGSRSPTFHGGGWVPPIRVGTRESDGSGSSVRVPACLLGTSHAGRLSGFADRFRGQAWLNHAGAGQVRARPEGRWRLVAPRRTPACSPYSTVSRTSRSFRSSSSRPSPRHASTGLCPLSLALGSIALSPVCSAIALYRSCSTCLRSHPPCSPPCSSPLERVPGGATWSRSAYRLTRRGHAGYTRGHLNGRAYGASVARDVSAAAI